METRHQTAIILLSDIQEFTKLVREDEENALVVLKRHREVFDKVVVSFKGNIIHHQTCISQQTLAQYLQHYYPHKLEYAKLSSIDEFDIKY